eukprot:6298768-Prymnesium_polylepis.1
MIWQSIRGEECQMSTARRATKASSRTVEFIDGIDVGSVRTSPTRRASMDLCCRRTSSAQSTAAQLSSTGLRGYL